MRQEHRTRGQTLFLFFSNRLGCFGSILVSALLTLFLLVLFDLL